MGKLIYVGNSVSFSTLREFVRCEGSGFTTASSIRGRFFTNPPNGVSSTGSFAGQFRNQWINSRCWYLTSDGGGTVAVLGPWNSGYSDWHWPATYAVTQSYDNWVTINAAPNTNYSFAYWYRVDPYEIWSYSAYVSYYIPTSGWQDTYRLTAVFNYTPPPPPTCYGFNMWWYSNYEGQFCDGTYAYGYTSESYNQQCFAFLNYGGSQQGLCQDPNCLIKGTSVEMADGTHKLIEKIRVGDKLKGIKISDAPDDDTITGWSTDTLNLVETEVKVTAIHPVTCPITYIFNNGVIESSREHAHFIKRDNVWKFEHAEDVQIGDFLVDKQGNSIEITSIEIYEYVAPTETDPGKPRKIVYDMDVETTDTYIANGLITHNVGFKIA